jgi:hypothetical protein
MACSPEFALRIMYLNYINFIVKMSRPALGSTQLLIQCVLGALSPGVKRPGHEADHSTPASVKVKNMLIYTSTPPYTFMP